MAFCSENGSFVLFYWTTYILSPQYSITDFIWSLNVILSNFIYFILFFFKVFGYWWFTAENVPVFSSSSARPNQRRMISLKMCIKKQCVVCIYLESIYLCKDSLPSTNKLMFYIHIRHWGCRPYWKRDQFHASPDII